MDEKNDYLHNIFYRHFDLPTNFPIIGLLGNSWEAMHSPVTRLHFHNCLEIGYVYKGSGELYLAEQRIPFAAPCIVLSPANVPHLHYVNEGETIGTKWLYLDPVAMVSNMNPRLIEKIKEYQLLLSGPTCVLPAEKFPRLISTLETLIYEMENPQQYYKHIVRELICSILLMLLRTAEPYTENEACITSQIGIVSPALTYIEENYMNDISIDHLARLCHVSTSHFRRIFKKNLGWTPLDYVQLMRIDRACELLFNCDHSVTEIGLMVGFPSSSSFNRQFHKLHGISPSQWRHKMQSEENPMVTAYFDSLPPITNQF